MLCFFCSLRACCLSFTFSLLSTYNIKKLYERSIMENCSNLISLSAIACKISECLSEKEVAVLSADLVVLSDMLANILAHKELCDVPPTSL
ncbi:MAG: DUF6774 domain-containing protein [Roseburia sp.]